MANGSSGARRKQHGIAAVVSTSKKEARFVSDVDVEIGRETTVKREEGELGSGGVSRRCKGGSGGSSRSHVAFAVACTQA